MDPVSRFALILQAFVLILTACAVIAFLYRVLRAEPLAVEIEAIPEGALVGRHRADREWPQWLLDGWRTLAEAGVPAWTC